MQGDRRSQLLGHAGRRAPALSRAAKVDRIVPNPQLKLMEQVREVLRLKHYSIRTEQCYCDWIRRYVHFHGMKSAFHALLFLYREVLRQPFESVKAVRAKVRMTKVSDLSLCWKFRPWIRLLPLCAFKSSKT